jgi:putative membrane protein
MNHPFVQLLLRWAILALGVTFATKVIGGIHCEDAQTLVIVVVLLSFFNAILKPVLVLFTLPFIVLTLGLGIIVINALLFLAVGGLVHGFHVDGFWSAVGGSIVVSFTNFVLSRFFRVKKTSGGLVAPSTSADGQRTKAKRDDVIDI